MRSYPLYVDGRPETGRGWTYVVDAAELIEDPRPAFRLKRRLEMGELDPAADECKGMLAGRCSWGADDENLRALAAAARASRELREYPLEVFKAVGRDFHEALLAARPEFVDVLVAEGHPRRVAEWEVGGILEACSPETLEFYFSNLEQEFSPPGRRVVLRRVADGVVCVNPPQNAAAACAALGVSALLPGNALVVKAPKSSPLGVMYLYHELVLPVCRRHGLPPGTVNLVSGNTNRILREWLDSPLVDDVMFFGDSQTGLRVGQDCVARGKKPILELSGNDAMVVWHDADLDGAAAALGECFHASSQICMVPNHAIVHPDVADELIDRMVAGARRLRPGYPDDADVVLSPVTKGDQLAEFTAQARERGCEVLTGGDRVDVNGERTPTGRFHEPTVIRVDGLERAAELRCVREETFFPLLAIVVPDERSDAELLDEVVDFVNANPYGLRNSLWATDPGVVSRFVGQVVNGGMIKVNESHVGFVPYLATHGGTGMSGGPFGELNYPVFRTSHLQGVSYAVHAQPPPQARERDAAAIVG
ncbi:MAG TPA: aldehyde dehydrogenase [Thermoleophilaceae bacterium]